MTNVNVAGEMKIEVTMTGNDDLSLRDILQRFADEFWLPAHVSDEQASAMILDSFKRRIEGEMPLMKIDVRKVNESR